MWQTVKGLLENIWTYASSFPLSTIATIGATVISVVALIFVLSRTSSPTSRILATDQSSDDEVDKRTDEVVRLVIKKDFVKDLVRSHLDQQAVKPRFTFKEFVLYGMPALITLSLVGLLVHAVVLSKGGQPPDWMAQAFTAVIAYYFGAAAGKNASA